MKTLLILLSLLLSFSLSFGQVNRTGFNDLHYFVQSIFKAPISVRDNCEWQYAVIKLTVDDNNRVTQYTTLNEVPKDFFNCLARLKGYQFEKNIPIHKKTVVFYFTVDNENLPLPCDVPPKHFSPTSATTSLLAFMGEQQEKQPNTIFILKPISIYLLPSVN